MKNTHPKSSKIGILLVLTFNLISAAQGVYLGRLFQKEPAVSVMVFTFLFALIFYLALELIRPRAFYEVVRKNWRNIALVNFSTLASWLGFFLALKYIEPAIVSVLCFAIGPLIMVLFWRKLRPEKPVLPAEWRSSLGIVLGLGIMMFATFVGKSGVGQIDFIQASAGLLFGCLSGTGIVGNTIFSKRLSDVGISAKTVMALRFYLLILVGLLFLPETITRSDLHVFVPKILCLSILTVIVPLLLLQMAIERCEPITISLLLCTLPLFTYVVQLMDARLIPSLISLFGLLICTGFAVVGVRSRFASREVASK